jgi:hypothetical protein
MLVERSDNRVEFSCRYRCYEQDSPDTMTASFDPLLTAEMTTIVVEWGNPNQSSYFLTIQCP